jgi:hypothetical protein
MLLASRLNPILKFGPGLAQQHKDYLWAIILHQFLVWIKADKRMVTGCCLRL